MLVIVSRKELGTSYVFKDKILHEFLLILSDKLGIIAFLPNFYYKFISGLKILVFKDMGMIELEYQNCFPLFTLHMQWYQNNIIQSQPS
jgi:hypothetical protein